MAEKMFPGFICDHLECQNKWLEPQINDYGAIVVFGIDPDIKHSVIIRHKQFHLCETHARPYLELLESDLFAQKEQITTDDKLREGMGCWVTIKQRGIIRNFQMPYPIFKYIYEYSPLRLLPHK